ncbi:MAG: hypothetical protein QM488_17845 [Rhizobiaceae bacterium]
MRIFVIFAMLISSVFAGQASASDGKWHKPALLNCEAESSSKSKRSCNRTNFCLSSTTEACSAHVGNTTVLNGREFLLAKCFDEKLRQCLNSMSHSTKRSTNFTNNPDGWDCVLSNGSKTDPDHCRRTNYCLDISGVTCSEKIGPAKHTPEGQGRLIACIKEHERSCFQATR